MSNRGEQSPQKAEQFYSFDQSKADFSFREEQATVLNRLTQTRAGHDLPIQQSSYQYDEQDFRNPNNQQQDPREQEQQNPLQRSNVEISMILQVQQLQCSLCLQKQIDCLKLPEDVSAQQMEQIKLKIQKLKKDQENLANSLQIFNGIVKATKQNNQFISKEVQHFSSILNHCDSSHPKCLSFNKGQNLGKKYEARNSLPHYRQSIKTELIQKASYFFPNKSKNSQNWKKYQIKPNLNKSSEQRQLNTVYKQCSLAAQVVLLQDINSQYRVVARYSNLHVQVQIGSIKSDQKEHRNYVYGISQSDRESSSISEIGNKLRVSLSKYEVKRFMVNISIFLIVYAQKFQGMGAHKTPCDDDLANKNRQVTQISRFALPIPMNYFIQPRFNSPLSLSPALKQSLLDKMFIYSIDILYNVDSQVHQILAQLDFARNHWISLRGKTQLLWLDIGKLQQIQSQVQHQCRLVFKVGGKNKNSQELVDLIEYISFMLTM